MAEKTILLKDTGNNRLFPQTKWGNIAGNIAENDALEQALSSKQGTLSQEQLAAANSGITTQKVSNYDGYSTSKQDALTTVQLNAVNSGITSSKVSTYDGYSSSKQNALSAAQLNAVNSGITSSKVSTYNGYSTSKQDKLTAGSNISITNNVISATGIEGSVKYNQSQSLTDSEKTQARTNMGAGTPISLGVQFITTEPTDVNTDGLKFCLLSSEPVNRYSGWVYLITQ